ncbi:hypothetical protein ACJX0J_021278, partial [Zea mays]
LHYSHATALFFQYEFIAKESFLRTTLKSLYGSRSPFQYLYILSINFNATKNMYNLQKIICTHSGLQILNLQIFQHQIFASKMKPLKHLVFEEGTTVTAKRGGIIKFSESENKSTIYNHRNYFILQLTFKNKNPIQVRIHHTCRDAVAWSTIGFHQFSIYIHDLENHGEAHIYITTIEYRLVISESNAIHNICHAILTNKPNQAQRVGRGDYQNGSTDKSISEIWKRERERWFLLRTKDILLVEPIGKISIPISCFLVMCLMFSKLEITVITLIVNYLKTCTYTIVIALSQIILQSSLLAVQSTILIFS